MIVTCDQCRAKFRIDDSRVGTRGVKVRCSKCSHTFIVRPQGELTRTLDLTNVVNQGSESPLSEGAEAAFPAGLQTHTHQEITKAMALPASMREDLARQAEDPGPNEGGPDESVEFDFDESAAAVSPWSSEGAQRPPASSSFESSGFEGNSFEGNAAHGNIALDAHGPSLELDTKPAAPPPRAPAPAFSAPGPAPKLGEDLFGEAAGTPAREALEDADPLAELPQLGGASLAAPSFGGAPATSETVLNIDVATSTATSVGDDAPHFALGGGRQDDEASLSRDAPTRLAMPRAPASAWRGLAGPIQLFLSLVLLAIFAGVWMVFRAGGVPVLLGLERHDGALGVANLSLAPYVTRQGRRFVVVSGEIAGHNAPLSLKLANEAPVVVSAGEKVDLAKLYQSGEIEMLKDAKAAAFAVAIATDAPVNAASLRVEVVGQR